MSTRGKRRGLSALAAFLVPSAVAAAVAFLWLDAAVSRDEKYKITMQLAAGLVALFGLYVAWRRSEAALKQAEIAGQGHVTGRFTTAVEQLGSEILSVRLGAIYALGRIARDSARSSDWDDYWDVLEVLCAFAREKWKHRSEKDAFVAVLNRQTHLSKGVEPRPLNLNDAELSFAKLSNANLSGATFRSGKLYYATLAGAKLRGVDLTSTDLRGANLSGADLYRANFFCAKLGPYEDGALEPHPTNLSGAKLQGAQFWGADLTNVNLNGADLRDVDFGSANLHRANLLNANLRGADLRRARVEQQQLAIANGSLKTKLSATTRRPASWTA